MSNLKIKLSLITLTGIAFFNNTIQVAAKPIDPCTVIGGCVGGIETYKSRGGLVGGRDSIVKFILDISNILVYISAAVAVIVIVFSGWKMLFANGDDARFKKGRDTLVYAVIGLIVAILAGTIVTLVSGIGSFQLR